MNLEGMSTKMSDGSNSSRLLQTVGKNQQKAAVGGGAILVELAAKKGGQSETKKIKTLFFFGIK